MFPNLKEIFLLFANLAFIADKQTLGITKFLGLK
jgi:hypothetical protein